MAMSDQALSLNEAAVLLGWSRRTLLRSLSRHGIPTIGTGRRRARLDAKDLENLKAKERAKSASAFPEEPRREARRMIETLPVGPARGAPDLSYWKRRLGQINRRSPIEKATSPLNLILYFTDIEEIARELDVLQRALEEATPYRQ